MSTKFKAIKYQWQNKLCYIALMSFQDINDLVNSVSDLSMNRDIDQGRVDSIKDYLIENIEDAFFPSAILNCNANINFSEEEGVLEVLNGSFTIIDGQHRIRAIKDVLELTSGSQRAKLKNMNLPVLLIEGLENHEHRNLFYTINESAKKVDKNISTRFSTTLENLLGLRYFSEDSSHENLIDWENKQSNTQIIYIHLADCIKELNKALDKFVDEKIETSYNLLYKNDEYYVIIKNFIEKILNFISILNDEEKKFFVTKKFLKAVTARVCTQITAYLNSKLAIDYSQNDITELINEAMRSSLQKLIFKYEGIFTLKTNTYLSLANYLSANDILHKNGITDDIDERIKAFVHNYIKQFYDQDTDIFSFTEQDKHSLDNFSRNCIEHKDELLEIPDLIAIELNKEISVQDVLQHNREEETVES